MLRSKIPSLQQDYPQVFIVRDDRGRRFPENQLLLPIMALDPQPALR